MLERTGLLFYSVFICFVQVAFSRAVVNKAEALYRQQIGDPLAIFKGPAYQPATNIKTRHPFFLADYWMKLRMNWRFKKSPEDFLIKGIGHYDGLSK